MADSLEGSQLPADPLTGFVGNCGSCGLRWWSE